MCIFQFGGSRREIFWCPPAVLTVRQLTFCFPRLAGRRGDPRRYSGGHEPGRPRRKNSSAAATETSTLNFVHQFLLTTCTFRSRAGQRRQGGEPGGPAAAVRGAVPEAVAVVLLAGACHHIHVAQSLCASLGPFGILGI